MLSEFRRGHVAQTTMGSLFIVLDAPCFFHFTGVVAAPKNVQVKAFVSKLVVEALNVSILPRVAGANVDRIRTAFSKPGPELFGYQLGPVVRTKVFGGAMQ